MIFVEGGSLMMGSEAGEAYDAEKPVHKVSISPFYLGKFLVIQEAWGDLMGENPSINTGNKRPVENVSWEDAQIFIEKLNKSTRKKYRLPTEAEWEYAVRGGKHSEDYLYSGSDKLKEVGWYEDNSNNETHEIGLKMGNELGLYDMSGNVYEWVEDQYHNSYKNAPADGIAWVDLDERARRVVRGGSCFLSARSCRVSSRDRYQPDDRNVNIGFRLALSAESVG